MDTEELAARVEAVCTRDAGAFDARVREEAAWLLDAVAAGRFDSDVTTIGLEYEFYGADDGGALQRLDPPLGGPPGCEAEVGCHQLELQSSPQPLSPEGLDAIDTELRARYLAASDHFLGDGGRLVSDGVWTVAPRGEDAEAYLTDHEATANGVPLASNMVDAVRFHAQSHETATQLDAPNLSLDGETVLLNSLTTSIQPHYALREAATLPEHLRYALRIAGPLLALGVNSPLFPPELYDDADPETILAESRKENRIGVFESVMNPADGPAKVDFPEDVDSVAAAVEDVVADRTLLPEEIEDGGPLAHFTHKHGCYWRWVRPVFDERDGSGNVRIEFRPLPGQPTLRDSVAFVGLFAGLMNGLVAGEHPVRDLDWATARENFYRAAADGLDADLRWIDHEGRDTTSTDALFADLFEVAREGLRSAGFDLSGAATLLAPLAARAKHRVTPADWKLDRARARLAAGQGFPDAVRGAQQDYIREQATTFLDGRFDHWQGVSDGPEARPIRS